MYSNILDTIKLTFGTIYLQMKIYLIRYGQTTGDVEDRYGGAYDDELSDKGKIQAEELANKIDNSGIQILFVVL